MSSIKNEKQEMNLPSYTFFFIVFGLFFSAIAAQAYAFVENNIWSYILMLYTFSIFSLGLSSQGNFSYYYIKTITQSSFHRLLGFKDVKRVPLRCYYERIFFFFYTVIGLLVVIVLYIYYLSTNQTALLYIDQLTSLHYILIIAPVVLQLVFELSMILIEENKVKQQRKSA